MATPINVVVLSDVGSSDQEDCHSKGAHSLSSGAVHQRLGEASGFAGLGQYGPRLSCNQTLSQKSKASKEAMKILDRMSGYSATRVIGLRLRPERPQRSRMAQQMAGLLPQR